jgi:hypothetical protein
MIRSATVVVPPATARAQSPLAPPPTDRQPADFTSQLDEARSAVVSDGLGSRPALRNSGDTNPPSTGRDDVEHQAVRTKPSAGWRILASHTLSTRTNLSPGQAVLSEDETAPEDGANHLVTTAAPLNATLISQPVPPPLSLSPLLAETLAPDTPVGAGTGEGATAEPALDASPAVNVPSGQALGPVPSPSATDQDAASAPGSTKRTAVNSQLGLLPAELDKAAAGVPASATLVEPAATSPTSLIPPTEAAAEGVARRQTNGIAKEEVPTDNPLRTSPGAVVAPREDRTSSPAKPRTPRLERQAIPAGDDTATKPGLPEPWLAATVFDQPRAAAEAATGRTGPRTADASPYPAANPRIVPPPNGQAAVRAAELAFLARLQPTVPPQSRDAATGGTTPADPFAPADVPEAVTALELDPLPAPSMMDGHAAGKDIGQKPPTPAAEVPGESAKGSPHAAAVPASADGEPPATESTREAEPPQSLPQQPTSRQQPVLSQASVDQALQPRPVTVRQASEAPSARPAEAPESPTNPDRPPAAQAPMRDISLRVSGSPSERVEVRLTDRTGDIRLAVRSSDPELTRSLRTGLGDLVDHLERAGYQTETWRPQPSSPGAGLNHGRESDSGSHYQGSPQQGGSGSEPGSSHDRNPRNQPRWVEELQAELTPGQLIEE